MHIVSGYPLYCAEANDRKLYYEPPHIYGWLYYDGDRHGTVNYSTWRAKIISRMNQPSPVAITMRGSYNPGNGTGTIMVKFRNDSTSVLTGRVIIVLTEDSLFYVGPNLDSIHNHVARDYLPDDNGSVISIPAGDSVSIIEPFAIDSAWNEDYCGIIAWIQNDSAYADSTREIWQGGIIEVTQLIGIEDQPFIEPVQHRRPTTTVFEMPPDLPRSAIRVINPAGETVSGYDLSAGIYFLEVAGEIKHKLVIIR